MLPAVQVILTPSDLSGTGMVTVQELLNNKIHIQDPSHQAVHLLVQALKPNRQKGIYFTIHPTPKQHCPYSEDICNSLL